VTRGRPGVYQDPRYCPACKLQWWECKCGEGDGRPSFVPCARCGKRYAEHDVQDHPDWTLQQWRDQTPVCANGAEFLPGLRVRLRRAQSEPPKNASQFAMRITHSYSCADLP